MAAETKASKDAPCVGIYWGVPNQPGEISIVIDVSVLAEAEPYGDFLSHPRGHYDVWEAWRRLGPTRLARRVGFRMSSWCMSTRIFQEEG
jgi:hypothetical protein